MCVILLLFIILLLLSWKKLETDSSKHLTQLKTALKFIYSVHCFALSIADFCRLCWSVSNYEKRNITGLRFLQQCSCDMMLCNLVSGLHCLKALCSFITSWTTHQMMQHHIPEDLHPETCCFKTLCNFP